MTFPVTIVVRRSKTTGHYYSGLANELPLSDYEHIKDFGQWYGSQMKYRPYLDAKDNAHSFAMNLNKQLKECKQ